MNPQKFSVVLMVAALPTLATLAAIAVLTAPQRETFETRVARHSGCYGSTPALLEKCAGYHRFKSVGIGSMTQRN